MLQVTKNLEAPSLQLATFEHYFHRTLTEGFNFVKNIQKNILVAIFLKFAFDTLKAYGFEITLRCKFVYLQLLL